MIKLYFTILLILCAQLKNYAQNTDSVGNILKKEMASVHTGKEVISKLDNITKSVPTDLYHFDEHFEIITIFDRDVDFNIYHQRIYFFNFGDDFQIDILKRNDTILLYTINISTWGSENNSVLVSKHLIKENKSINEYIKNRNEFYHTNKNLKDILYEISLNYEYAINAGYGYSLTEKAKEIQRLLELHNHSEVYNYLKSFNIENQAYGIYGLELMKKKKIKTPKEIKRIAKHIKKRNSDTLICAGCICGIVQKMF